MAIVDSSTIVISWAAAALTAVEDCNGINVELANGEHIPYGAPIKKKMVTGVMIADDVSFKVPLSDAAGSDYVILNTAWKAKTEAAFKVAYGATYYRQLSMTCIKCDPIPAGGETTMVQIVLVNTGAALTQN